MATLTPLSLSKKQVKEDLKAFKAILDDPARPNLGEKSDILPFFDARPHICAFMGTYNPNIVDYKKIYCAREFDIFGDYAADLAVGDVANHEYCFIEFEDASETSVFKKTPSRRRNGRPDSSTGSANSSIGFSGSRITGAPRHS